MNLPNTRDSLILRLPDGVDAEAWEEFSAIYEPIVYRFARRNGLQDADAHELVQDVMLSVSRAVRNWVPDKRRGRFRTWLFRIAKNHLIDQLRKRRPDQGSGKTSQLAALGQVAEPQHSEQLWQDEYRREMFRSASAHVQSLVKPQTWQAFWRTAIEGQDIAFVAQSLGMSVTAVYIARCRVIHRLKNVIEEWEREE